MKGLLLLLTVAIVSPLAAQKKCKTGKPCGDSCIAKDKVCRIGTSAPARVVSSSTATARPPDSAQWVASSVTVHYYRIDCAAAKALPPEGRRYFATEQEAANTGYTPSPDPGCASPPTTWTAASPTTLSGLPAGDSTWPYAAGRNGSVYYSNQPTCVYLQRIDPSERVYFRTAPEAGAYRLTRSMNDGC